MRSLIFGLSLLTASSAFAQGRTLDSCPLLKTEEVAGLLGKDAEFLSASEADQPGGLKTGLCNFSSPTQTLTIVTSPSAASGDRVVWEQMRELAHGTTVPGLGEYAYTRKEDGKINLFVVSAPYALELRYEPSADMRFDPAILHRLAETAIRRLLR